MPGGQGPNNNNNNNKSLFGHACKFCLFSSFHIFTNYFTDHFRYYPACEPLLAGWKAANNDTRRGPLNRFSFLLMYIIL
jgi:hypothetical protein